MDAMALDFWLGEWNCAWDGGHGTNSVTRELDVRFGDNEYSVRVVWHR